MKIFLLALALVPLASFAQEAQNIPSLQTVDPHGPYRCALNSDMYCHGKPVGAICVMDPQPPYGRSGLCRQRGNPVGIDVTCVCR